MTHGRNAAKWTTEDVGFWLQDNGFEAYQELFCVTHKIDGLALLYITEEDLKNPPLSITVFGDIKRLTFGIGQLRLRSRVLVEGPADHRQVVPAESMAICDLVHAQQNHQTDLRRRQIPTAAMNGHKHPLNQDTLDRSDDSVEIPSAAMNGHKHSLNQDTLDRSDDSVEIMQPKFEREILKTVISYVYVTLVIFLTAFVMVEVHERVPDIEKYPPLPDIALDNLPYMPWAFKAAELSGIVLTVILLGIIIMHKHKYIVLRRLFAITGTVFLLRCLTMFVTALSVPDHRLECAGKMYGDFDKKFWRAVEICSGFGMSLTGVRTCGDYMFSGHTIVLTTWNHFITEYSPRNCHLLHTLSWILNIFGCFFILAAHEHYSIDVIIAFYITSRLFLYYHTLANSQAHKHADERMKVWFPMFSFFEANMEGPVPNEYEWPLSLPRSLGDILAH